MLASHRRALARAIELGEPPGQIAARQLEIERIEHALRRADELDHDVAAAIEAEADGERSKLELLQDGVGSGNR